MNVRPVVTLIAAVSADGFISTGQGVPWDLPADRAHFREMTRDRWLLLGRRTYQEMLGWFRQHHPLVLTHDRHYRPPIGEAVAQVKDALHLAATHGVPEVFVCGGGGAYAAAMPWADRLVITHVGHTLGSGVPFPAINPATWRLTSAHQHPADDHHAHPMQFATYERTTAPPHPGDPHS